MKTNQVSGFEPIEFKERSSEIYTSVFSRIDFPYKVRDPEDLARNRTQLNGVVKTKSFETFSSRLFPHCKLKLVEKLGFTYSVIKRVPAGS